MSVAVCVATCRRPEGLARLLRGLDALSFGRAPAPALRIVVVDNDPEGSARTTCDALAPSLRWPLEYAHEPQRGISHARNRAVACACDAEWIAFIDDDEVPEPRWLDELLATAAEHGADVVMGPVPGRFEQAVPEWVARGRFFEPRRLPTGTPVEHAGAGNVLIRTAALEGMDLPFDPRFSLSGGEDTHFFLRMGHAGRKLVWADEAVAYESIPPARTRLGWLLRRVYRSANTWSLCERELRPSPRVAAVRAAKGLARIGVGMAMLPVAWLFGRHVLVRALWYIAFGAGNLTGLAGLRSYEYRTLHGR